MGAPVSGFGASTPAIAPNSPHTITATASALRARTATPS